MKRLLLIAFLMSAAFAKEPRHIYRPPEDRRPVPIVEPSRPFWMPSYLPGFGWIVMGLGRWW